MTKHILPVDREEMKQDLRRIIKAHGVMSSLDCFLFIRRYLPISSNQFHTLLDELVAEEKIVSGYIHGRRHMAYIPTHAEKKAWYVRIYCSGRRTYDDVWQEINHLSGLVDIHYNCMDAENDFERAIHRQVEINRIREYIGLIYLGNRDIIEAHHDNI